MNDVGSKVKGLIQEINLVYHISNPDPQLGRFSVAPVSTKCSPDWSNVCKNYTVMTTFGSEKCVHLF